MPSVHSSFIPSKQEAAAAVKSGALSYIKNHLIERMDDFITPNEEMSTNNISEMAGDDDVDTIAGVQIADEPQFKESKLYESSIDSKLKAKKKIFNLLANVITYTDFIEALGEDKVVVDNPTANQYESFDPQNPEHMQGTNELLFTQSLEHPEDKIQVSSVVKRIFMSDVKDIKLCTPGDNDLHEHLDGIIERVPSLKEAVQGDNVDMLSAAQFFNLKNHPAFSELAQFADSEADRLHLESKLAPLDNTDKRNLQAVQKADTLFKFIKIYTTKKQDIKIELENYPEPMSIETGVEPEIRLLPGFNQALHANNVNAVLYFKVFDDLHVLPLKELTKDEMDTTLINFCCAIPDKKIGMTFDANDLINKLRKMSKVEKF